MLSGTQNRWTFGRKFSIGHPPQARGCPKCLNQCPKCLIGIFSSFKVKNQITLVHIDVFSSDLAEFLVKNGLKPVKTPQKIGFLPLTNQEKNRKFWLFLESNVFQITLVHVDVFSTNLPEFLVKNSLKTGQNTPKNRFFTPEKSEKSKILTFLKSNVFQITLEHVDVFSTDFPEFLVKNGLKPVKTPPKIDFLTLEKSEKIENFDFFEIERFSNYVSTCRRVFNKFARIFSQKWPKTGQNTPKNRFSYPWKIRKKSKILIFWNRTFFKLREYMSTYYHQICPNF